MLSGKKSSSCSQNTSTSFSYQRRSRILKNLLIGLGELPSFSPSQKSIIDMLTRRTKKKDIYVISTPKRPVPLEHYLYAGRDTFKIVDAKGEFLNQGYVHIPHHLSVLLGSRSKVQRRWRSPPPKTRQGTRGCWVTPSSSRRSPRWCSHPTRPTRRSQRPRRSTRSRTGQRKPSTPWRLHTHNAPHSRSQFIRALIRIIEEKGIVAYCCVYVFEEEV